MYQNYGLIYPYRIVRKKTAWTIGSLFFHIIVLVQMLESKKKSEQNSIIIIFYTKYLSKITQLEQQNSN